MLETRNVQQSIIIESEMIEHLSVIKKVLNYFYQLFDWYFPTFSI